MNGTSRPRTAIALQGRSDGRCIALDVLKKRTLMLYALVPTTMDPLRESRRLAPAVLGSEQLGVIQRIFFF